MEKSTNTPMRPAMCEEKHLIYLDELRESGDTNMFGATPYLLRNYPSLNANQAVNIVAYWMKTFGDPDR